MSRIDFLEGFYSSNHDIRTFYSSIDSLFLAGEISNVHAFSCFISDAYFKCMVGNAIPSLKLLHSSDGIYLFSLSKKDIECKLFIISSFSYRDVYSILTFCEGPIFKNIIVSFFRKLFPVVSLTFITHKRLQNLLNNFSTSLGIEKLIITRTSTRTRVEGKPMKSVNWSVLTFEEAFRWVLDENGWFQSITFRVTIGPTGKQVDITLSRDGIIRCTGLMNKINDAFLEPFAKTVNDNVKIFSKRARIDNIQRQVKPLYIDLGSEMFREKKENANEEDEGI
jgi:hypothetical protein